MGSKAAQGQTSLPGDSNFLYVLPRDKEVVQIVALAFAFESAWSAHNQRFHTSPTLLHTYIRGLLLRGPKPYLQTAVDGRRGTNNEIAWNAIFAQVVRRAVPAMLALLACDAALVRRLSAIPRPSPDLAREMHRGAMANFPALLAIPENEPLLLIWPLSALEQEGGERDGSR